MVAVIRDQTTSNWLRCLSTKVKILAVVPKILNQKAREVQLVGRAEIIGAIKSHERRMGTMKKLKTIGIAQTIHRGLLHEAGYPVNVVVRKECWDALVRHKDANRESTRVWDLLFSTRLHLGGGIGNEPPARSATLEVACGRKVGTVTAQTCTDCLLISLPSENVSLPARDHSGLLEAGGGVAISSSLTNSPCLFLYICERGRLSSD